METICLQCGDEGFTNAFVYCVRCLAVAVHRLWHTWPMPNYCLDAIPETFDEYVRWVCDGCEVKRKNKLGVFKHDIVPCKTGVQKVPENVNRVSGVETAKSRAVAVNIEAQVCKDFPHQLSDESVQPDLIICAEFNENSPTEFREMNDKHEEIKGQEPNSSQQLEEENNGNLMKCASTSDEISLKEMVDKKRIAILKPSLEKDQNRLIKDVKDCTLPAKVKKSKKRDRRSFPQGTSEAETGRGSVELPIISCDESFRSSKKMKTTISPEANLEKQRHGTCSAQILNENKGPSIEIQCFDVRTEGRGSGPSNDHYENNIMVESREEKSVLHHVNYLLKFPDDSTMVPSPDSHRRPVPIVEPIWRGSFNIWNKEQNTFNGLMAHLSTKTCQKAYEESCQLQTMLPLEMLPKSDIWPKSFQISEPTAENIALYFFPSKTSEWFFYHLLDKMMREELGLRAIVQNAELLVFPSNELPLGYWMFQNNYYLWGVFRGKELTTSHSQSGVGESGDRTRIPAGLSTGNKTLVTTRKSCDPRSPRSPLSNSGTGSNGSGNS